MEEGIMYSTELIRKLPESPDAPILYVVYNRAMIQEAEALIGTIHGDRYLANVKVVPFDHKIENYRDYNIYIDPIVYTYKNSWNN